MRSHLSRPGRRPLALALLSIVLLAPPAQAQFGIMKRAIESKVGEKADDKMNAASLIEPTFNSTTLEITQERLDKFMAALQDRRAHEADRRKQQEDLNVRINALRDQANKVDDRKIHMAWDQSTDRYKRCRDQVETDAGNAAQAKNEAVAKRMQANPLGAQSDPEVRKYVELMQKAAMAQQSGDTAAARRAQEQMGTLMTGGVRDSVSQDKAALPKCGERPPMPASVRQAQELTAQADKLQLDEKALYDAQQNVPGDKVGMNNLQAKEMEERLLAFLGGARDSAPITKTFSKNEYDLLLKNRAPLKKAFYGRS
jgi:hypothetical protein